MSELRPGEPGGCLAAVAGVLAAALTALLKRGVRRG